VLLEAQSARFAELDPLLPAAPPPADGDAITAALPDGRRVAGVLVRAGNPPGSLPSLWSARESTELQPLVGAGGAAGVGALLKVWRQRLDLEPLGPDSAALVHWPSRDAEVSRILLDHGLVPLTVIAVRRAAPVSAPPTMVIRPAGAADLDTVLQLALAELSYSALVGGTVLRPDAVELKRAALAARLRLGDPVWLAERDGIALGLAECGWHEPATGGPTAGRLPPGRWAYVNCMSVLPGARGTGIGQQLMSVVHRDLHQLGAAGTYLFYNPANALSSVFWVRQGYRPLWTIWEVRPASALR
jgi:GNAT superfamily N-acetyltransferase